MLRPLTTAVYFFTSSHGLGDRSRPVHDCSVSRGLTSFGGFVHPSFSKRTSSRCPSSRGFTLPFGPGGSVLPAREVFARHSGPKSPRFRLISWVPRPPVSVVCFRTATRVLVRYPKASRTVLYTGRPSFGTKVLRYPSLRAGSPVLCTLTEFIYFPVWPPNVCWRCWLSLDAIPFTLGRRVTFARSKPLLFLNNTSNFR